MGQGREEKTKMCGAKRIKSREGSVMKQGVMIALCGVLGVMSVSTTAHADELMVQVGAGSHQMHAPAYDAISAENSHAYSHIEVGYAAPRISEYVEGLLIVQAGGDSDATYRGSFTNSLRLDWRVQRVMAGADVGVQVGRFFRPSVKLGVGYAHQRLDLLSLSGEDYVDHAHDVVGFGAIGGRLMVPISIGPSSLTSAPRLKLGLQAHWGYMAQTMATFDELTQREQDEENPWTQESIDLGDLQTRGRLFMGGVFIQVRL